MFVFGVREPLKVIVATFLREREKEKEKKREREKEGEGALRFLMFMCTQV